MSLISESLVPYIVGFMIFLLSGMMGGWMDGHLGGWMNEWMIWDPCPQGNYNMEVANFISHKTRTPYDVCLVCFGFLAMPRGLWDFSSPTRGLNPGHSSDSAES